MRTRPLLLLLRLAVLLLAAALVTVACGDDESGGSSEPAAADANDDQGDAAGTVSESGDSPTDPSDTGSAPDQPASDDAGAGDAETRTRVASTTFGDIEVPIDPQRVIALDAISALLMVSVGVDPALFADPNGAIVLQGLLDQRGIEMFGAGDGMGETNFEAIAGEQPDLLITTAGVGFIEEDSPLRDIAPVVVVPFDADWRDQIADVGEVFDRMDEARRVIGGLDAELAEVSAAVDAEPVSVSIVMSVFGQLASLGETTGATALISEAGIGRPEPQRGAIAIEGAPGFSPFSEEFLTEHDADFLVVLDGVFYDSEVVEALPTYPQLDAVRNGNAGLVDGDLWFSAHPFSVYWILQDLDALVTGAGVAALGDQDDVEQRWAEFVELAGI